MEAGEGSLAVLKRVFELATIIYEATPPDIAKQCPPLITLVMLAPDLYLFWNGFFNFGGG